LADHDVVGTVGSVGVMGTLLDEVLAAHGGAAAFAGVRSITADMSFGGPFWAGRGWPGVLDRATVRVSTDAEDITFTPFPRAGFTSRYQVDAAGGELLTIRDAEGSVSAQRTDPRPSFPPYDRAVGWDVIQTCYFASTASWNYLTEPFLFARPDVTCEEVEPWDEEGQTWRRLAVTFPATLPNHNPHQVFYFDDRFMLRRMDYHPDVTGSRIAHYTEQPREFDGFVFYARRLVYPRAADGRPNKAVAVITIDTHSVTVERG
jgi:hypothetical protein